MKKILLVCFFSLIFIGLYGQSQDEMNFQAKLGYEKADKELNQIYLQILHDYKNDTIFIKCAKETERQWIKFRDAQVEMKYPPDPNSNGSVLPMCQYFYLTELTYIRIKELKQWVNGVEEGDVCSGSIKIKQ